MFSDLNAFLTENSLQGILPNVKIKRLILGFSNSPYRSLPESHLIYMITQKILTNMKFVFVGEDDSFKINDLRYRFEQSVQNLTFMELFSKYFPQMFSMFRPLKLAALNLAIDTKLVLTTDIFPLNLNERLCALFEYTYNYEIQFSTIHDQEFQYSILPSFREGLLIVDYIFHEVTQALDRKTKV